LRHLLHDFFADARLDIEITDRFGKKVSACPSASMSCAAPTLGEWPDNPFTMSAGKLAALASRLMIRETDSGLSFLPRVP
jgi:hypothetical protein